MTNICLATLAVLCLVATANAQSIADIARKERERQAVVAAAKKAEEEKNRAARPVPQAPLRNNAGFQNCGRDMACFATALTNRKPAFVQEKVNLDGTLEYTYYQETSGFSLGAVTFYRRVDESVAKYSEEAARDEMKKGRTRRQLDDEEKLMSQSLDLAPRFQDFTCTYAVAELSAALKDWQKRPLTMAAGFDFVTRAENCTGPLVEGIKFKTGPARTTALNGAAQGSGARIDGMWGGTVGDEPFGFDFKVAGGAVTGKLIDPSGKAHNIVTGKLEGNNLTFGVDLGFEMFGKPGVMDFDGVVNGDTIKFTNSTRVNGQGGRNFEARRVK